MDLLRHSVQQLLREMGPGRNSNTAYDTAWLVRLGDFEPTLSKHALQWLCEHQLPDGSWGARELFYYHDRVICTLAAVNALAKQGKRAQDQAQWQRGLMALENLTRGKTKQLIADPHAIPVGFELIVPTLLTEAEALGVIQNYSQHALGWIHHLRMAKLNKLQGQMISRHVSTAFSAEMAGVDAMRLLDVENLQESNGSIGNSPAATAYFATQIHLGDAAALEYLRSVVVEGGAPDLRPWDIFERAWVMWNLTSALPFDDETMSLCQPHLDYLAAAWQPKQGVSFSVHYLPKDADNTCFVFEILSRFGQQLDLAGVLHYEDEDYFRCYDLETHPSVGVNIHVVSALRQAGLESAHPSVQKALRFLEQTQVGKTIWFDKWHVSPYYATSHTIIACAGYADNLIRNALEWILSTQKPDGSWGYYMPTAEETAYSLQALTLASRHGHSVPSDVLRRGSRWLADHWTMKYPPLWIGKCLYCPEHIVRSAILSAFLLVP